jgi:uncharacterized membrane protein YccF (DUF307 family)
MTFLLNAIWFVFGGWISALAWIVAGLILAVTVIGLPWTPAAFRMARFSAAPFGLSIMDKPGEGDVALVLNLVWILLAGWWLALHHLILAVLTGITIIGIPFALQHLKLAQISLAPVGKEILGA